MVFPQRERAIGRVVHTAYTDRGYRKSNTWSGPLRGMRHLVDYQEMHTRTHTHTNYEGDDYNVVPRTVKVYSSSTIDITLHLVCHTINLCTHVQYSDPSGCVHTYTNWNYSS